MEKVIYIGKENVLIKNMRGSLRNENIRVTVFPSVESILNQKTIDSNTPVFIVLDTLTELKIENIRNLQDKFNLSKLFYLFFNRAEVQDKLDLLINKGEFRILKFNDEDVVANDLADRLEGAILRRYDYPDVKNLLSKKEIEKNTEKVVVEQKKITTSFLTNKIVVVSNVGFGGNNHNDLIIEKISNLETDSLVIDLDFSHTTGFSLALTQGKKYNFSKLKGLLNATKLSSSDVSLDMLKGSAEQYDKSKQMFYIPAPMYLQEQKDIMFKSYLNLIKQAKKHFDIIVVNINRELRLPVYRKLYRNATNLVLLGEENPLNMDIFVSNYRDLVSQGVINKGLETAYHIPRYKGSLPAEAIETVIRKIDKNIKISLSEKDLVTWLKLPKELVKKNKKGFFGLFRR